MEASVLGFVARSVFWLGLVYSAMPLDFGSLLSDAPAGALSPCAHGLTDDCRKRVDDLRKTVDAAAALGLFDRTAGTGEPPVSKTPAPTVKAAQAKAELKPD